MAHPAVIPTEPIGSIPRSLTLLDAIAGAGDAEAPELAPLYEKAARHPRVETPEEMRDRILEATRYIPIGQLGTTDDCGFSPFCDDRSTSCETAFAKIRARVLGTAVAMEAIGGS